MTGVPDGYVAASEVASRSAPDFDNEIAAPQPGSLGGRAREYVENLERFMFRLVENRPRS